MKVFLQAVELLHQQVPGAFEGPSTIDFFKLDPFR